MATKADKKRWDDLHAAWKKVDEAVLGYEIELRRKYGPYQRPWLSSAERKKLDALEDKRRKIGDKIFDLLVRVSPRGDAWLHGVPSVWVYTELTWEDAIRPKNEPLSVVTPGGYGFPAGSMRAASPRGLAQNELRIGSTLTLPAGWTIGAGKLRRDTVVTIDRVDTSSDGAPMYGIRWTDAKTGRDRTSWIGHDEALSLSTASRKTSRPRTYAPREGRHIMPRAQSRVAASSSDTPIANPGDLESHKTLFIFSFGAYLDDHVHVWADHFEDAFEIAVEWVDDNSPGHLFDLTIEDYKEAAEELGIEWDPEWPDYEDRNFEKVAQAAEVDLTQIGHTTLKHGQFLRSWEWSGGEVTDQEELEDTAVESYEEDRSAMMDVDYSSEGPNEKEPTQGLRVESSTGGYIDITEWTDIYDATGDEESEGDILRVDARVDINELLDPDGKHRGSYSGDNDKPSLGEVLLMDRREQEDAIVAASIAYLGYFGGEESHVGYIGE